MNKIVNSIIVFFWVSTVIIAGQVDIQQRYLEQTKRNAIPEIPGKRGMALDFNKADKPAWLAKVLRPAKDGWSLECWLRFASVYGKSTIVSSNAWRSFLISIKNGKVIVVRMRDRDNKWFILNGYYDFIPGLWYHLAITMSPDHGMKIYVNGALAAVKKVEKAVFPHSNVFIKSLGAYTINPDGRFENIFKGALNRPLLYDRTLGPDEIAKNYASGNQKLGIVPEVQQVDFLEKQKCRLPSTVSVSLQTRKLKPDDVAFIQLNEVLKKLKSNLVFANRSGGLPLVISDSRSKALPDYVKKVIPDKFPQESYCLFIREKQINLIADDGNGFYYGLLTLAQILEKNKFRVMNVFDFPAYKYRGGLYVCDTEPPIKLSAKLKKVIADYSRCRINYLQLRTHDWVAVDRPEVAEAVLQIKKYAEKYHMKIIPYLQCYGHSKAFLWRDLRAGHTRTINDEKIILGDKPVSIKHKNLIITENTPIIVQNSDHKIFVENRDYKILPGTIKTAWKHPKGVRYGWAKAYIMADNKPFKIERIKGGAIKSGQTVLVTYDVATGGEGYCPLSPQMHKIFEAAVKRTIELIKPDYINLGMDEIWEIRGQGRCCMSKFKTNSQALEYEVNRTAQVVKKIAPDVKVMIFGDMFDENQTPAWKSFDGKKLIANHLLDRDIIMMPWYYAAFAISFESVKQSTMLFLDNGYETVGTCGNRPENVFLWGQFLLMRKDRFDIPGITYTLWASSKKYPGSLGYAAYTQNSWSPDRMYLYKTGKLRTILDTIGVTGASTSEEIRKLASGFNSPSWLNSLKVLQLEAEAEVNNAFSDVSPVAFNLESYAKAPVQAKLLINLCK